VVIKPLSTPAMDANVNKPLHSVLARPVALVAIASFIVDGSHIPGREGREDREGSRYCRSF
jgi:hypothetical protein